MLQSARDNQLVGYGLVIGLQGTGDSLRNSPFTEQSIRAMLENLGIAMEGGRARAKNVAAVIVTANLPRLRRVRRPHRRQRLLDGRRHVAARRHARHDAAERADGEIYAVAQGPVIVSGFTAAGPGRDADPGRADRRAASPNGAIVERQVAGTFAAISTR